MWTPGRTALLLIVVTALLYAPTLTYGWLYEDLNDPETSFRPFADTAYGWLAKPARSLSELTFATTQWAFPGEPRAQHAVNLALHLLNGVLFYGVAAACLRPWAAVFALGVFLLHPVQVESVAYVSSRADLVATAAVLAGVRAVIAGRWGLVMVAAICAFLAKETAVIAVALFAWVAIGRGMRLSRAEVCTLAAVSLPFVLYLLVMYPLHVDPMVGLTQLAQFSRLLVLVVWPVGLTIDHDWSWINHSTVIVVASAWVCAIVVAWAQRWTTLLFAIGWCLIVVSPRLVVPLVEGMHEHHLYLPLVAIALLSGALMSAERDRYGVSASFA